MTKTIFSKDHKYTVEQLKKARLEASLDQADVAKLLGKTQPHISKIEAGQRRLDITQLKEFAKIYKKICLFHKINMQKRTLAQIKKALKELSEKGWIKSNRSHNTGIGKTLEDYLGITENNIALPDFGVMELKSQRAGTSSMMTLFTKKPEGITNAEILKRFGYPDPEFPQHKILHQTITNGKKNERGFHCKVDEKQGKLLILKNRTVLGYYELDFLRIKVLRKLKWTYSCFC